MENASKALIIAASVLIAVMLFAFMMYMFNKTSRQSGNVESKIGTEVIEAFNSNFTKYETGSDIPNSFTDETTRLIASKKLNNIADVLSAVNLSYNINYKNNNSYHPGNFEKVNTVEIKIDLSKVNSNLDGTIHRYYFLEPCKGVEPNCVYGTNTKSIFDSNKSTRISNFTSDGKKVNNTFTPLNLYDLISQMNQTKVITRNDTLYTIYEYYFLGSYQINRETHKIDSLTFTAVKDTGFDSVT